MTVVAGTLVHDVKRVAYLWCFAIFFVFAVCSSACSQSPTDSVAIYRFSQGHNFFLTTDCGERADVAAARLFPVQEIIGHANSQPIPGTHRVYRFNTIGTSHLYTISESEGLRGRFREEAFVMYLFDTDAPHLLPLYRLALGVDHLYTTDRSEYLAALTQGWRDEGLLGYVDDRRDDSCAAGAAGSRRSPISSSQASVDARVRSVAAKCRGPIVSDRDEIRQQLPLAAVGRCFQIPEAILYRPLSQSQFLINFYGIGFIYEDPTLMSFIYANNPGLQILSLLNTPPSVVQVTGTSRVMTDFGVVTLPRVRPLIKFANGSPG